MSEQGALRVLTLNTWGLWIVSKQREARFRHLAQYLEGASHLVRAPLAPVAPWSSVRHVWTWAHAHTAWRCAACVPPAGCRGAPGGVGRPGRRARAAGGLQGRAGARHALQVGAVRQRAPDALTVPPTPHSQRVREPTITAAACCHALHGVHRYPIVQAGFQRYLASGDAMAIHCGDYYAGKGDHGHAQET